MHELACGAANERGSPGAAATPQEAQGRKQQAALHPGLRAQLFILA